MQLLYSQSNSCILRVTAVHLQKPAAQPPAHTRTTPILSRPVLCAREPVAEKSETGGDRQKMSRHGARNAPCKTGVTASRCQYLLTGREENGPHPPDSAAEWDVGIRCRIRRPDSGRKVEDIPACSSLDSWYRNRLEAARKSFSERP